MRCEVVTTRGGARAVLDRDSGEVMHPVVGPLVESVQLYVGPSRLGERLTDGNAEPLRLFDVGLGAGSNALAALKLAHARAARRLDIVSFDRSRAALALTLEHPADFALEGVALVAARALCDDGHYEDERVRWRYVEGELPGTLAGEGPADLVYWDPFSPRANPELWGWAAFAQLRRACAASATVFTYSGATAIRAALLLAGFAVGEGEAIGESKHATCAAVQLVDLARLARPLDGRWLARLERSSAPFPADAPADPFTRIAAMEQFAGGPRAR